MKSDMPGWIQNTLDTSSKLKVLLFDMEIVGNLKPCKCVRSRAKALENRPTRSDCANV